ncbi:MAG: radical SAM protein [Methanomicrobiales archaeon]|nr:radical SAM protein [Methanomicrobiales archaeon]
MPLLEVTRESGIPLLGCLYFGIVDRGTNLLQVRPSCSCNLCCPFCSVDAGPCSRTRAMEYAVEVEYLLDAVREVSRFKGEGVEAHIDSPGEPMLHRAIAPLVKGLKEIPEVRTVSMQTNGTLLSEETISALEAAGLDRMNLSIHALDRALARRLSGVEWYDVEEILRGARMVAEGSIDLLIAPVLVPGMNDAEMPKLIEFALKVGAGRRWPPLGIQKYERYRWGRHPPGVRPQSWREFYRTLEGWGKEFGIDLILSPADFGIERRAPLPRMFRKGERTTVEVRAPGWLRGEMLGVARGRVVSILNCPRTGGRISVRMVSTKDGIYVAAPV